MNRILFVGICLLGIVSFALTNPELNLEKQSKTKVVKHNNAHKLKA